MSRGNTPTKSRLLWGICGLLAILSATPPALAAVDHAYLWGIRRGCHSDSRLEEAALSRIRAVGREIVLLNVPTTTEMRSCSGELCAALIRQTATCASLSGSLLGAELDEQQTPTGVVIRIRAWRAQLGSSVPQHVAFEHIACSENCGTTLLAETTAKALNRLLDRAMELMPSETTRAAHPFPSAECIGPSQGMVPPAYCREPLLATCREEDLVLEPTGRMPKPLVAAVETSSSPPSRVPRKWEWLPIAGSALGLVVTATMGILNESLTIGPTGMQHKHILTPAFWSSATATAILGITSIVLVSDRYRREIRTSNVVQPINMPTCPLLIDSVSTGKIR